MKTKQKKAWEQTGTFDNGDYIIWETKKRSSVYKGQPKITLILKKHPINKHLWVVSYGQALNSMPNFKTKKEALAYAMGFMEKN